MAIQAYSTHSIEAARAFSVSFGTAVIRMTYYHRNNILYMLKYICTTTSTYKSKS